MSKDDKQSSSSSAGIGFFSLILGLVQTTFILAAVFGVSPVNEWSWWKVLIPLWVWLGLGVSFLIGVLIVVLVMMWLDK